MSVPADELAKAKESLSALENKLQEEAEERKRVEQQRDFFKIKATYGHEPRILSPVITSASNWYELSWLLSHEPVRQWIVDLEGIFSQGELFDVAKNPWKGEFFFEWITGTLLPYLKIHYTNVDEKYVPWVASRAKTVSPAPFVAAHTRIMALLEQITKFSTDIERIQKLPDSTRERALQAWTSGLREKVLELCSLLKATLDEQERVLPPLVAQHFTEQEERAFVESIMLANVGDAHIELSVMVHGMEMWATPEMREAFLCRLSGPGRWTLENYWLPSYVGRNVHLLKALALQSKVNPPALLAPLSVWWLSVAVPVFIIAPCTIS